MIASIALHAGPHRFLLEVTGCAHCTGSITYPHKGHRARCTLVRVMTAAALNKGLSGAAQGSGIEEHIRLITLIRSARARINPPNRIAVDSIALCSIEILISERSGYAIGSSNSTTTPCVLNADRVIIGQISSQHRDRGSGHDTNGRSIKL